MSRFLAVSSAVLRKDCRELWPQAVPTAAVVTIVIVSANARLDMTWLNLLRLVPLALITLLIVRIIQSDSPATVQHDWLTRPIPWAALLVAKAAFMFLWIAVPYVLGATVQSLISGYPLGEALLEGVQRGAPSPALLGIIVAAAITASLWQALLLLAGTLLFLETTLAFITAWAVQRGLLDLATFRFTGTDWVRDWSVSLLGIIMCVLTLWWQYSRRKIAQARTLYAGLVMLALLASTVMLPTANTFAVQQQLGPNASAAWRMAFELTPGCFASRLAAASVDTTLVNDPLGRVVVPDELLKSAGGDAVAFSTVLVEREPVRDGHLILGRPVARYVDAEGRELFAIRGFGEDPGRSLMGAGRRELTHHWLLPRSRHQQLIARRDVRLQIDYSLSLLVPRTRVSLPVDGPREFHAGLGYCGARRLEGYRAVLVDCFKAGPRPTLVLANEAGGEPSAERIVSGPDFTPAMLSLFAGRRDKIQVDARSSYVEVTAYEVRAHFERRITSPGILGGTQEACPAPDARAPAGQAR